MPRKATVLNIIIIPLVILTIIIGAFLGVTFLNNIITGLDGVVDSGIIAKVQLIADNYPLLDWLILFILAGLFLLLYVTGKLVPSHPAFLVFGIIGLFVATFIGGLLSNFIVDFVNNSQFDTIRESLPVSVFLSSNLAIVCLVGGVLYLVGFYTKQGGEQVYVG